MDFEEPKIRQDGLQVSDNPPFQQIFWRVERLAWIAFMVIVILAILGFTGSGGPFSEAKMQVGTAEVTYTLVTRWQTSAKVSIIVTDVPPGGVNIALSDSFNDGFSIDSISPVPENGGLNAGGHRYHFAATSGAHGRVVFDMTARTPGVARFDLTVGDESRPVTILILP